MKTILIASIAGLALAVAACTEAERQDAGNDAEAAAAKVGQEAKEAVNSPELKELGSEIKEAAGDVAQVTKDAAKGAAEGAREGAAKVEGEARDEAGDAKRATN